jgi:hypothetical protein
MFIMDVISACTDENEGFISADKFKMSIYFNMKVLGLYTNLEVADDFSAMIEQYDALSENGTLNILLSLFTDEYSVICKMLDNLLEELLVQNSIDMQVVKIANKINDAIDAISEKLNDVNFNSILPEGTDMDALLNMINILK